MADSIELQDVCPESRSVSVSIEDDDQEHPDEATPLLVNTGSSGLMLQDRDEEPTISELVQSDCEDLLKEVLDRVSSDQVRQEVQQDLLLHHCINMGSIEMLVMLLNKMKGTESGGNDAMPGDHLRELINQPDQHQCRAVHAAVLNNNVGILNLLLQNNCQVIVRDDRGYTPLHIAAENGFSKCARILLKKLSFGDKKKLLEALTTNEETALILASKKSIKTCQELTLPKVFAEDMDGCGARQSWGNKGYNVLMKINAQDVHGKTALHYAAGKGNHAIIKFLLDHHANTNVAEDTGVTLLCLAISSGKNDLKTFQHLLETIPPSDFTHENMIKVLKLATFNNSYNCVEELLSRSEMEKSIVNHRFPDETQDTALHMALRRRHYKIALSLIEHGARKDLGNDRREYPVHIVAMQPCLEGRPEEEIERLKILKKVIKGVHVRLKKANVDGESPMELAAKSGNTEMIQLLLRHGCPRMASIETAASRGYDAGLKLLLKEMTKQELDELKSMKPHPLHGAAQKGRLQCCKTLVQTNEKMTLVQDDSNLYPVDVAYKFRDSDAEGGPHQHLEVFRFLLGQMEFNTDLDDLGVNLHKYCKESINKEERQYVKVIVESAWCQVAFDAFYCNEIRDQVKKAPLPVRPCDCFAQLVKRFPNLACKVMDRFITTSEDIEQYDFTLFEFIYYNTEHGEILPVFGDSETTQVTGSQNTLGSRNNVSSPQLQITLNLHTQNNSNVSPPGLTGTVCNGGQAATSCPPSLNTVGPRGQISPSPPSPVLHVNSNSKTFKSSHYLECHPLLAATNTENKTVLIHPLPRLWMKNKYSSYAKWIIFGCIVYDLFAAIMTTVTVALLRNTYQLETSMNGSTRFEISSAYASLYSNNKIAEEMQEEIRAVSDMTANCLDYDHDATEETRRAEAGVPGSATWNKSVCAVTLLERRPNAGAIVFLQFAMTVIFLIHLLIVVNFTIRVRLSWRKVFGICRYLQVIFVLLMLIPLSSGDIFLGMRQEILWQFGVVCILLALLSLVNSLNKVPVLRVFMQISWKFCLAYLRIVGYIFLLILAFALPFHFMMSEEEPGFSTFPYSLIKTLTWMLGDLGYSDTFLNEEAPLKYPVLANLLFTLFITVIGGVVFNLVVRDPTDAVSDIREHAAYYETESLLTLLLFVDECFPSLRRRHAIKSLSLTPSQTKTLRGYGRRANKSEGS